MQFMSRTLFREHKRYPASPQELVGPYLTELPEGFDPESMGPRQPASAR